jgi:hypothetical protein
MNSIVLANQWRATDDRRMALTSGSDRRRLLAEVRDGVAAALRAPLDEAGFRFRRRDAAFHRERDGVMLELSFGISSRPPSMGGVGILVEPMMCAGVPTWAEDAERRLAAAAGQLLDWERPSQLIVGEALDWHVRGRAPHWTLPDEPTSSDIEHQARALRESILATGIPFLERLATKEQLLEVAASGERLVDHDARFTIACGAMLAGRPDLARRIIEPFGTARRESVASVLGLVG